MAQFGQKAMASAYQSGGNPFDSMQQPQSEPDAAQDPEIQYSEYSDSKCACGKAFLDDASFCIKCGTQRQSASFQAGALMPQLYPQPYKAKKPRVNLLVLLAGLVLPWLMFVVMFAVMSFSIRYWEPMLSLVIVALGAVITAGVGALYLRMWCKGDREPDWALFLFVSLLIALIVGACLGNGNYVYNMLPHYETTAMNAYTDVDPSRFGGQELMDAGRVEFATGVTLDATLAMGFKNREMYCVAPIGQPGVGRTGKPLYDLWAVGKDCCSGNPGDFHCGDYADAAARSGVRAKYTEDSAFFRLAVQQAEAAYNIEASHALFFQWSRVPENDIKAWGDDGVVYFIVGIVVYLAAQLLLVMLFAARALWRPAAEKQPLLHNVQL